MQMFKYMENFRKIEFNFNPEMNIASIPLTMCITKIFYVVNVLNWNGKNYNWIYSIYPVAVEQKE